MKTRQLVRVMAATALLFVSQLGWAQPNTVSRRDRVASQTGSLSLNNSSLETDNTGTDAVTIGSNVVQVATWDGVSSKWSMNRGTTSYSSSALANGVYDIKDASGNVIQVTDPDIIISPVPFGTNTYPIIIAGIASIGGQQKVLLSVFEYNSSTNAVTHNAAKTCTLSNGGVCSNPNIDVNDQGEVAVVWSEIENKTSTIEIIVDGVSYGPYTTTITTGDIFLAVGKADGTGKSGTGQITGNNSGTAGKGDPLKYLLTCSSPEKNSQAALCHLGNDFQQGLYPDVAISTGGSGVDPTISVCFVSSRWQVRDYTKKLIVRQVAYSNTSPIATYDNFSDAVFNTRPRIASPPSSDRSAFEMVQSNINVSCTEESGFERNAYINNWGKSGGILRTTPTRINAQYDDYYYKLATAVEPVVTFSTQTFYSDICGERPYNDLNKYTVSWAWVNNYYTSNYVANRFDILAATAVNGYVINGNYNLVNAHHNSNVNNLVYAGDQTLPSIAGRHLTNQNLAFAHYSSTSYPSGGANGGSQPGPLSYIGIKYSNGEAGAGQFREGAAVNPLAPTGQVEIYPNPTSGQINAQTGDSDEEITGFDLVDVAGRLVKRFDMPKPGKRLEWRSAKALPAGIYTVQVKTTKGVVTKSLVVE